MMSVIENAGCKETQYYNNPCRKEKTELKLTLKLL